MIEVDKAESKNNFENNIFSIHLVYRNFISFWFFKKDVDGVFEFLLDDQRGKDLLDDCKAANIRFEYEKDGEKFYFGADEGEIISIEWVEPSEIPNSKGVFSQESNLSSSIKLNKELSNNYDIRETIAHEMQTRY